MLTMSSPWMFLADQLLDFPRTCTLRKMHPSDCVLYMTGVRVHRGHPSLAQHPNQRSGDNWSLHNQSFIFPLHLVQQESLICQVGRLVLVLHSQLPTIPMTPYGNPYDDDVTRNQQWYYRGPISRFRCPNSGCVFRSAVPRHILLIDIMSTMQKVHLLWKTIRQEVSMFPSHLKPKIWGGIEEKHQLSDINLLHDLLTLWDFFFSLKTLSGLKLLVLSVNKQQIDIGFVLVHEGRQECQKWCKKRQLIEGDLNCSSCVWVGTCGP
jgi:hypothetical protein